MPRMTFKTNIGKIDWHKLGQPKNSTPPCDGDTLDLDDDTAKAVKKRGWADEAAAKPEKLGK